MFIHSFIKKHYLPTFENCCEDQVTEFQCNFCFRILRSGPDPTALEHQGQRWGAPRAGPPPPPPVACVPLRGDSHGLCIPHPRTGCCHSTHPRAASTWQRGGSPEARRASPRTQRGHPPTPHTGPAIRAGPPGTSPEIT